MLGGWLHVSCERDMPMNDERSFIAAMLDEPAVDVHRLIFADWLEERGRDAALLRQPGHYGLSGSGILYWLAHGLRRVALGRTGAPGPACIRCGRRSCF